MVQPSTGLVINVLETPGREHVETATLVRTDRMEVVRVALAEAQNKPAYKSPGDVTIHCLEGRLNVMVEDQAHELRGGQLIHLAANVPHSLHGLAPSVALLTIVPTDIHTSPEVDMATVAEHTVVEDGEVAEPSANAVPTGRGPRG